MDNPQNTICELIRSQTRFLVISHHRPDGDAIGSQLALVLLLKQLGKDVTAWNEDPVPAKFRFLPDSALIQQPPTEPQDFDVVITIDTSTWARAGTAAAAVGRHQHFINIDHHVSNEGFATINWVVPDAPASGQIVYDLIKHGGFPLTPQIATCLFAAISTDTGSFSYANTTSASLRVAAELVDTGIDVGEISRHVYESYPYARLHMLQRFLSQMKLAADQRLAYSWVTREMFTETGAMREDTEGLIDYIRAIDGVLVAALFEELPDDNQVRISLRSKHPAIDVNQVALQFGGGGHREAAGARPSGSPEEVEVQVVTALGQLIERAPL